MLDCIRKLISYPQPIPLKTYHVTMLERGTGLEPQFSRHLITSVSDRNKDSSRETL